MASITKGLINDLQRLPKGREQVLWDETLPGFGVRRKASGAISYLIQYRNASGVSRRFSLGRHGVLTPQEARAMAKDRLADVRRGQDPADDRQKARNDPTIMVLCDLYLKQGPQENPSKKQRSWDTDRSNIERHIKKLLGRKHLMVLTRQDVSKFQKDVTDGKTATVEKTKAHGKAVVEGGPGVAARATAVLRAILNFAVREKLRADNPARGVKLNKGKKCERFLSSAEFARLSDALQALEQNPIHAGAVAAIRLLMFTGARKNEIAALRWDHVDVQRSMLLLPDSKCGAKPIPLGAPALEVLSKLERKRGVAWVFPAKRGNGHFQGLSKVWEHIRTASGLSGVRMHDLRHSFASVSAADGNSLFVIGKLLGHRQASTTERYAHLADHPVLHAADRTAKKIAAAMTGASAEIVPLTKRSGR